MKTVYHNCICIVETGKAILVEDEDGLEAWVPLSQVHLDSEVFEDGTEGDLVINDWYADKIDWL